MIAIANTTFQRVRNAILGQMYPPDTSIPQEEIDKIGMDTIFVEDLGFDSLEQIELVAELEEEFDINIPDVVSDEIRTVGDAVRAVDLLVNREI